MAANARKSRSKGAVPTRPAARSAPPTGAPEPDQSTPINANGSDPLQIKKYANRRFYDVTRSRHLTLADIHELILAGHEVRVSDATTGQDITNAILTQIILENEAPKLDFFPPLVLHQIIRTQRQYLGGVMDTFFQTWVGTQRQSQQRWTELMQTMMGAGGAAGAVPSWMENARAAISALRPDAVQSSALRPDVVQSSALRPDVVQSSALPPAAGGVTNPMDWTRQMMSMWMPSAIPGSAAPSAETSQEQPSAAKSVSSKEEELEQVRSELSELAKRLEQLQRGSEA